MTSGPEHFKRADRILAEVAKNRESSGTQIPHLDMMEMIGVAQVHATLALAAATALAPYDRAESDGVEDDWHAWLDVADTPTPSRFRPKQPRLLDCGLCYEENGEEVHPHPECPL